MQPGVLLKHDSFSTLGSQTYYFAMEKEAKMRKKRCIHCSTYLLPNCDKYAPKRRHAVVLTFGKRKKERREDVFPQRYNILDPLVANYDANLWNSPVLVWYFFTSLVNVEARLTYVCVLSPRQKAQGWWAMRLPGISDRCELQSLLTALSGFRDPPAR